MEQLTYRKMICNEGHETRPYAAGEMLPRNCPVCNQPYDRRFNRPVLCREDGSVPQEESSEENVLKTNDPVPARGRETGTVNSARPSESGISRPVHTVGAGTPDLSTRRRGRSVDFGQPVPSVQRGGRGGSSAIQHSINIGRSVQESVAGIALYNGGDCIEIPDNGGILGRESIGQEVFGINPLISRKHAFVRVNRDGSVQVRDEGSLNGTFIDDGGGRRKLIPHETVVLKKGDRIWLANCILVIEEKR